MARVWYMQIEKSISLEYFRSVILKFFELSNEETDLIW